ncbi:lysis protein [Pseudomonas soli]|uniref:Lysis protein n=1 Tax=Pseudomonas soli TaxID=1306993 RepID=A0AAJ5MHN5_9PSED|nr:lysis protein [Pseudomonas soli]UXZ44508.1 lysis protein [Pseudomonas soli]
MTKYLLATIAALLVASLGAFWALDHTKAALRDKTLRIEKLEASERSRKTTIKLLAQLDTQHTQEITRARNENQALLDRIGTGGKRLSVIAKCPVVRASSTAASVDDAEARAELDPAHARRIVAIPADGDDAIRQLTALQDWVRAGCPAPK